MSNNGFLPNYRVVLKNLTNPRLATKKNVTNPLKYLRGNQGALWWDRIQHRTGLNPINENLSFEKFSGKKMKILNQPIFLENLKNFQTKYLVQLAGKDSEIFAQNFLIGTQFKNLRKFLEIREFCKNSKNIPLKAYRQSINMSVWKMFLEVTFF